MQNEALVADDDGVAGIRAALITRDAIRALAEAINNFALAFIAPLGADDDLNGHIFSTINLSTGHKKTPKLHRRCAGESEFEFYADWSALFKTSDGIGHRIENFEDARKLGDHEQAFDALRDVGEFDVAAVVAHGVQSLNQDA